MTTALSQKRDELRTMKISVLKIIDATKRSIWKKASNALLKTIAAASLHAASDTWWQRTQELAALKCRYGETQHGDMASRCRSRSAYGVSRAASDGCVPKSEIRYPAVSYRLAEDGPTCQGKHRKQEQRLPEIRIQNWLSFGCTTRICRLPFSVSRGSPLTFGEERPDKEC